MSGVSYLLKWHSTGKYNIQTKLTQKSSLGLWEKVFQTSHQNCASLNIEMVFSR